MGRLTATILAAPCMLSAGRCPGAEAPTGSVPREPIVGLPCEGCEAVFEGLQANLSSRSRLAPPDESGEALGIVGTVFDRNGRPAPGIIVYACHTGSRGIHPRDERRRGPASRRRGRLRGWAKTDAKGQYRFETIRPAGYPDSDLPAHAHMHVLEVGRCTHYIDDILFEDDPRLSPAKRRQTITGRGGSGLVMPGRNEGGTWIVTRDIILGKEGPGYPEGPQDAAGAGGGTSLGQPDRGASPAASGSPARVDRTE